MESPSAADDRVIDDISRKIERERVLIQGARTLRNSTSNALVQQKCDTNIHEGLKNIEYLEERLKQLRVRKRNSLALESGQSLQEITEQAGPNSNFNSNAYGSPFQDSTAGAPSGMYIWDFFFVC